MEECPLAVHQEIKKVNKAGSSGSFIKVKDLASRKIWIQGKVKNLKGLDRVLMGYKVPMNQNRR